MSDFTQLAGPRTMKDFNGETGTVSYGMDGKLHVQFYIKPFHMEYLSQTLGHPIFQDRIFVKIIAPGNTKTVWDTTARGIKYDTAVDPDSGEYHTTWELLQQCENGEPTDAVKYPKAWDAFMSQGRKVATGWPIEEWGAISRSYCESLKALGVFSVEAMAELSDSSAANIMGGVKYRELAKAALSEQKRNEIVSKEQEARARTDETNKALNARIDELMGIIQQMQQNFAAGTQAQAVPGAPAATPAAPKMKSQRVKQSARTAQVLANTGT